MNRRGIASFRRFRAHTVFIANDPSPAGLGCLILARWAKEQCQTELINHSLLTDVLNQPL